MAVNHVTSAFGVNEKLNVIRIAFRSKEKFPVITGESAFAGFEFFGIKIVFGKAQIKYIIFTLCLNGQIAFGGDAGRFIFNELFAPVF